MKRAPHPKGLLPSSPVTASLATAVMNGKYVNAVPLYRLEKELESLRIAGCWVHCSRKFEEALKVVPKGSEKESLSYLIMKQIQAIYREENKLKDLKPEDRLKQRRVVIKPLVDALFVYLKNHESEAGSNTLKKAFTFILLLVLHM